MCVMNQLFHELLYLCGGYTSYVLLEVYVPYHGRHLIFVNPCTLFARSIPLYRVCVCVCAFGSMCGRMLVYGLLLVVRMPVEY
jgi:hypothetical protein